VKKVLVRRLISGLLALLLVVGLVALASQQPGAASAPAYTPVGPGEVYLALGDSLAWGALLEDPATQSYPALLHARLSATVPIELVNLAVPGETSGSFLRRQLPQALARIERERAGGRRVSPITLDIGGNDLQYVAAGTPAERAAAIADVGQNLEVILDELRRATGGDADIAVMTYYNPYGGDPTIAESEAYWVTQLNAVIRAAAAERGMAVADTYAPFDGGNAYSYTHILIGDIHATRQGHQVIATQFWQALEY
jgi:lysophospholipase L1-like esterase